MNLHAREKGWGKKKKLKGKKACDRGYVRGEPESILCEIDYLDMYNQFRGWWALL